MKKSNRKYFVRAVIGAKRHGKTSLMIDYIDKIHALNKRNVLILDPFGGEDKFKKYREITDFEEPIKNEIVRYSIYEAKEINIFAKAYQNRKLNGLIVFDDFRSITADSSTKLRTVLIRSGHMNSDFMFSCHSLADIYSSIVPLISQIWLKKFTGDYSEALKKLSDDEQKKIIAAVNYTEKMYKKNYYHTTFINLTR